MKILQLCKKFPYPPKDGETIAILNFTRAFHRLGHQVTVLSINTKKHYYDLEELPEDVRSWADFQAVDVNTDVHPFKAAQNLLTNKSYHIQRFVNSRFEKKLRAILQHQGFDIVQLEGLYLTPYLSVIKKCSNAKVVLRSHNVEFEIWERIVRHSSGWKKWYLHILANRLKNYELEHLNEYDAIVPISPRDEKTLKELGCRLPMMTLPGGIDLDSYVPGHSRLEYPSVFMLGGLDWLPNQEGVKWFVQKVWPLLLKNYPRLRFYIAGRHAPQWMQSINSKNVVFIGEVEDAKDFYRSKAVMVVPLLSGSGMRIKILEGLALKKAIVTTGIGMEGIAATDGKHLLIANEPHEFAAAIEKLVTSREFHDRVGMAGRQLIEEKYDQQVITKSLINFYKNILL